MRDLWRSFLGRLRESVRSVSGDGSANMCALLRLLNPKMLASVCEVRSQRITNKGSRFCHALFNNSKCLRMQRMNRIALSSAKKVGCAGVGDLNRKFKTTLGSIQKLAIAVEPEPDLLIVLHHLLDGCMSPKRYSILDSNTYEKAVLRKNCNELFCTRAAAGHSPDSRHPARSAVIWFSLIPRALCIFGQPFG
jgi:hypothetical protein